MMENKKKNFLFSVVYISFYFLKNFINNTYPNLYKQHITKHITKQHITKKMRMISFKNNKRDTYDNNKKTI